MQAFFFDLDDTLFDHRHATRAALAGIQQRLPSLAALTLDELEVLHGAALERLHLQVLAGELSVDAARVERLRELLTSQGATADDDALQAASAAYRAAYLDARRAVPGAIALLRALRPHGAIGVISNNLAAEQAGKLAVCGLSDYVDVLVVSEEAGVAKPEPAIFHDALRRVGADAQRSVMTGDSWSADILGARVAGLRAVWFNPLRQPCPEPGSVAELASWEPVDDALRVLLAR